MKLCANYLYQIEIFGIIMQFLVVLSPKILCYHHRVAGNIKLHGTNIRAGRPLS